MPDTGYSTPSGHVLGVCLLLLILWVFIISKIKKKDIRVTYFIFSAVFTALVMCSRLYLHVHYPSDILASILMSILWCNLALFLIKKKFINLKWGDK
ncbi:phosphatase PAP2 family protein [Weissella paramesenteroides]|uniref:phosphatase PAP2 family protein n=1 Tax=Weissella paramesenteroides TaxID=1249 RepID=UPI0013D990DC